MNRIYHPYCLWEENSYNMWGSVKNKKLFLNKAISFTGNHRLYGFWMKAVAKTWRYSCEHNLSHGQQNKKAWIGHAACALAFRCPEDIVRQAWSFLNEHQQILANQEAENAIKYWEEKCQKQG